MANAKITSKGQVTVPKEIRDQLGIHNGDTIRFVVRGDVAYLELLPPAIPGVAFGVLHRDGQKPIALEEARRAYRAARSERASPAGRGSKPDGGR